MRNKLDSTQKRSQMIGVKVKPDTKEKLEFIAGREARPLSTQIDIILKDYIDNYFKIAKINWEEYKEEGEK